MRNLLIVLALFMCAQGAFAGIGTSSTGPAAIAAAIKTSEAFLLPTEGVVVTQEGVKAGEATRFAQVIVSNSELFGSQFQAQRFCQGFDRRGLRNHCRVRAYGDNFFGADYRFVVRGQGQTRLGALNAILNFLQQFNLILDQIQLVVDFFSNE